MADRTTYLSLVPPLCLLLVGQACGSGQTPAAQNGDGDAEPMGDGDSSAGERRPVASAYLLNVETGEADPRFSGLPGSLSSVELLPRTTLAVDPPPGVLSVSFSLGDQVRVDLKAPFVLTEGENGEAEPWAFDVGRHLVTVSFFASTDGTGEPLETLDLDFEITAAGTDSSPEAGQHSQHNFWIGTDGVYNTESGGFAFMILLPEGYDPDVRYPLVTFLHHGWDVYRGIDNNGRPLTTSAFFNGTRSIISSQSRIDFPAVVLVPQLPEVVEIDGVTNEWAAFHSVSNETGDYEAAANPSIAGAAVFRIVDDLIAGQLSVEDSPVRVDSGRVYLAGHSMGGFGTWDLLWRRPNLWAAGVAMAGYQDHQSAAALVDMPIWHFHHNLDCFNPFHSGTMKSLIEAEGGTKMKLTELTFDTAGACDEAHFQTPTAAWNDEPELFEWIFSQARAR